MKLSLATRDQQVIWHPYTQHKNKMPALPAVSGAGALLFDENGKPYIDAVSSWWVNIHGHGHPYIAKKIYEQAKMLEHVIFTSFTHEPAVRLAERLLEILPGSFSKIFYSDNGSTAVEVALKMAIQYWKNQEGEISSNPPGPRRKILALRNAYHGDTFGAMSVSDRGVFTLAFRDYLFEVLFIDPPSSKNLHKTKKLIDRQADEIACFIYEPLLQGAAGMLLHEAAWLDELLDLLQSKQVICIADEVLTGFGRTGKLFACDFLGHKPDLICLSKGLTGGTMALGVTACTQKIFDAFLSVDMEKTFFHGHSFAANPIACSAGLASLDLLVKRDCLHAIQRISAEQQEFAQTLQKYPAVRQIRHLGTLLAFNIGTESNDYLSDAGSGLTEQALANGIYLRPLGNTVYIMPPYCITGAQLKKIHDFLVRFIETII